MTTNLVPFSSRLFWCKTCDYSTSRKSQYNRHLATAKHINTTNTTINTTNKSSNSSKTFVCDCGNEYKHHSSLWNHRKKCAFIKDNDDICQLNDIKEIMKYLIKENSEMKQMMFTSLKEQNTSTQNILTKIIENGINTTNTNNNTTNNNNTNSHNTTNNAFNLNFFLNETCKDAMNIDEFVSSIKVSLSELENTGRQGYIEGISNIILKRLNNLEQNFRPLHCSDSKREVFYIKDNNEWKKENEEKPLLTKAIKVIANENIKQIMNWREKYPDCTYADSKKNNLYLKIVSNSMNGLTKEEGDKNIEKIISNIAKEVIIDKTNYQIKTI